MPVVKITLIANAGILIEYNDQQILIDALHEGHRLYPATPPKALHQILAGESPYTRLQAVLVTHDHLDHFSARMVLSVLNHQPTALFLSDEKSADELLQMSQQQESLQLSQQQDSPQLGRQSDPVLDRSRIRAIPWFGPQPERFRIVIGDFDIQAISLEHEGRAFIRIASIGYLLTVGGKTILFPGDARMAPENYAVLADIGKPIDAAVLMFPYIATGRGQAVIRDVIKPRQTVIVHWPDPVRDSHQFTFNAKRFYEKTKSTLGDTVFLEKYGDFIELDDQTG